MEDILLALLMIGVVVGGWCLGIAGFVSARRALREIAALRAQMASLAMADTAAGTDRPGTPESAAMISPWTLAAAATSESERGSPGGVVPEAVVPGEAVPVGASPDSALDPHPTGARTADLREPVAPTRNLEDLLTARWGVWAGAVALLMAGVFLIRYAVEQSLLGPEIRCGLGFALGAALIAGAEWLRRRGEPAITDHAPPALAAGGLAILYGAAYGTGVLYGLVPPLIGFVLLAGVSLTGLALSLRFGAVVAAIGIAGAFVTPALIETDDPSLPGLFIYLLFVTAAALGVVRYTAWIWLGWATTVAGAVWVLLAMVGGPDAGSWAAALFVPATAALNLGLLPGAALDHPVGRRLAWVPCAALGVAGLLLALAEQGWDSRAGVLLLAPLMVWKAAREPRLRLLPFLAAALFLLLLAGWSVHVTDWPDLVAPPGQWTPAVVQALMATAALLAGFFAASGLWLQQRALFPLPWASLTASVPVLALAIAYARVTAFQTRFDWAVAAFLLAAGLVGTTAQAMRGTGGWARQVAGTHAAGAAAALALGCAMVLSDHWLSVAIALLLPALAWIEARADLPPLRLVARVVAGVVLVRLLLNWHVLDYAFGATPVVNGLLAAYGVPAAAFALAAMLFRRRGDDATVAVLQAGSASFATVLVGMEIRHGFGQGDVARAGMGFAEAALHVTSLAIMALVTLRIATRVGGLVLAWSWRIQGGLALLGGGLLLAHLNPILTDAPIGAWPLLDWLLAAYLLPAALALLVASHPAARAVRPGLALYALVAGMAWVTLEIRHLFHGERIGLEAGVEPAELWAWSGAWLSVGGALLVAGLRRGERAVRLAGITIMAATTVKVFVVDMSALEGLWRVLSFLGLGLALIAMGAVYRRLAKGMQDKETRPQGT
jgi:uncharacterized membrane protein